MLKSFKTCSFGVFSNVFPVSKHQIFESSRVVKTNLYNIRLTHSLIVQNAIFAARRQRFDLRSKLKSSSLRRLLPRVFDFKSVTYLDPKIVSDLSSRNLIFRCKLNFLFQRAIGPKYTMLLFNLKFIFTNIYIQYMQF